MSEKQSHPSHGRASAAGTEVLVACKLFNDLITDRLCALRRQELSTSWKCPCGRAFAVAGSPSPAETGGDAGTRVKEKKGSEPGKSIWDAEKSDNRR